jgi:hypothetical protein
MSALANPFDDPSFDIALTGTEHCTGGNCAGAYNRLGTIQFTGKLANSCLRAEATFTEDDVERMAVLHSDFDYCKDGKCLAPPLP